MDSIFTPEVVTVEEVRNKPPAGQYCLRRNPLEWIGCRERISALFKADTPHLLFSVTDGEEVARFIRKTEEIIELPEYTTFQRTNRNYIIQIVPHSFWKECPIRRSLFTILLRQGLFYDVPRDNYEDALYFYNSVTRNYTQLTRLAVTRFLFGFTNYCGPTDTYTGWVTLFKNAPLKTIRQWLKRPNPETNLIGAGTIWA
jgi:hypothetical protein